MTFDATNLMYNDAGLIPVITQDNATKEVLMMAWMNQEADVQTLRSGQATYWSRSRQSLWVKGESSGHYQFVESIQTDCDYDALLITVKQEGGIACHTGRYHCFFTKLIDNNWIKTEKILKDPRDIYGK